MWFITWLVSVSPGRSAYPKVVRAHSNYVYKTCSMHQYESVPLPPNFHPSSYFEPTKCKSEHQYYLPLCTVGASSTRVWNVFIRRGFFDSLGSLGFGSRLSGMWGRFFKAGLVLGGGILIQWTIVTWKWHVIGNVITGQITKMELEIGAKRGGESGLSWSESWFKKLERLQRQSNNSKNRWFKCVLDCWIPFWISTESTIWITIESRCLTVTNETHPNPH